MRRPILGGLVLLLVVAAGAAPSPATGEPKPARPHKGTTFQCPKPTEPILSSSLKNIEDSIKENGTEINKVNNSFNGLGLKIEEYIRGNERRICRIDEKDKLFNEIESLKTGGGGSIGLALAGAGLAASLLTLTLMGIWVWHWRRSLEDLLQKRCETGLDARLRSIEDLLRKRDAEDRDRRPQALETAAAAKTSSPPPDAKAAAPEAPQIVTSHTARDEGGRELLRELIEGYNKFLCSESFSETIHDYFHKCGMEQLPIDTKQNTETQYSIINLLRFYACRIDDERSAAFPDSIIFDNTHNEEFASSRNYELNKIIDKYFEVNYAAESRLVTPLILDSSNNIIERCKIQLRKI